MAANSAADSAPSSRFLRLTAATTTSAAGSGKRGPRFHPRRIRLRTRNKNLDNKQREDAPVKRRIRAPYHPPATIPQRPSSTDHPPQTMLHAPAIILQRPFSSDHPPATIPQRPSPTDHASGPPCASDHPPATILQALHPPATIPHRPYFGPPSSSHHPRRAPSSSHHVPGPPSPAMRALWSLAWLARWPAAVKNFVYRVGAGAATGV